MLLLRLLLLRLHAVAVLRRRRSMRSRLLRGSLPPPGLEIRELLGARVAQSRRLTAGGASTAARGSARSCCAEALRIARFHAAWRMCSGGVGSVVRPIDRPALAHADQSTCRDVWGLGQSNSCTLLSNGYGVAAAHSCRARSSQRTRETQKIACFVTASTAANET
eukprot:366245-Chlamydomonas_euryale.AAC.6